MSRAKPQTKVTDLIACKDGPWYPCLPHGGFVAYRIWQQFEGLRWFQRHEWFHADETTKMDEWIPSISGWAPTANEIAAEAA